MKFVLGGIVIPMGVISEMIDLHLLSQYLMGTEQTHSISHILLLIFGGDWSP